MANNTFWRIDSTPRSDGNEELLRIYKAPALLKIHNQIV